MPSAEGHEDQHEHGDAHWDGQAGEHADEAGLWVRLARHPLVQSAVLALTVSALFVLDRLTRAQAGPRALGPVLATAALVLVSIFAAGLLVLGLRRWWQARRNPGD
jgi:hypothetical protein